MRKGNLKDIAILLAAAFAWSKLPTPREVVVIPNGTTVQYIPLGKQNWRDAETGIVTGTLYDGGVLTHYQINDAFNVLIAYVRRV